MAEITGIEETIAIFDTKHAAYDGSLARGLTVSLEAVGPNRASVVTTLQRLVGAKLVFWDHLVAQLEHDDAPVCVRPGLSYPEARFLAHELLRLGASPAISIDLE